MSSEKYIGCLVIVVNQLMPIYLIPLDIVDFNMIIGIDWLHRESCINGLLIENGHFPTTKHAYGNLFNEHRKLKHILTFTSKVKCMLRKDCKGFLGHVMVEEDNLV